MVTQPACVLLVAPADENVARLRAILAADPAPAMVPLAVGDIEDARRLLASRVPDVIVMDISPAIQDGLVGLSHLQAEGGDAPIVVLLPPERLSEAVAFRDQGAWEVFSRDVVDEGLLRNTLKRAASWARLQRERSLASGDVAQAPCVPNPPQCRDTCPVLDLNTRLHQSLDTLKRAQEQLIHAERLGALGQMAQRVMHDFNNALMPIMGYTDLLLDEPGLLDRRLDTYRILNEIRTAVQRAAEEIRLLRQFYRTGHGDDLGELVDMNAVVERAVAEVSGRWAHEANAGKLPPVVEMRLGEIKPLLGRRGDLEDALVNLLSNARDATRHGGNIAVETRLVEGHVVLDVRDSGSGMSELTRQRCMEPFFSTKGPHAAGIGLTVVFGVAQSHGGRVDIESHEGKGTRVSMVLPAANDAAPWNPPTAK